ncbi:MAG: hypothetical protein ABSG43_08120 [Solirubrobacteraceae bacterium]
METLEREVAQLPEPQRTEAEEAITAVGSALMRDRSALKDAARLVHQLADEEPSTRAGQEARNLRRVFVLWRRAAEESLTAEDVGVSRQQLKHLRDAHKLLGLQLPLRRGFVYPAWQFDPGSGEPFAGIPRILAAAQEATLTTLGLHLLMVSTAAENGSTPADCLAAGNQDYVVQLVSTANAHGS